ncbi:MAG TPA: hypothetical protein VKG89_07745 [Solirubrobacterales bacterium]|nr:hypothetical protein [Solirubrobacterales bacterium]
MRRRDRNPAERLRFAVEALPERTREAMLRGISSNPIVVGAYVDRASGGICPMLAAHRNGGRTSLASFARAWDRYTGAKRPRLATRRELRTLRSLLETTLATDHHAEPGSIAEAAARIRADRALLAAREAAATANAEESIETSIRIRRRHDTGERHRATELRDRLRWSWMRPARRYEEYRDLVAAAEEQLADQRVPRVDTERAAPHTR